MSRLRLVRHGGIDNNSKLNIITCLLLVIYNGIDLIKYNDGINMYFLYVVPFLLYVLLVFIFNDRKINYLMYVFVGVMTLALDPTNSGLSGLVYMFFAYKENSSRKSCYAILLLTLLGVTTRFIFLNVLGTESIITILLFAFIFTTFYFKVVKQPKQIKNIDLLKEEEKAIVKLYCNGYSYEKISKTLSLNILPSTVRRKVTAIKDLNGINNDAQFGKWLHELV